MNDTPAPKPDDVWRRRLVDRHEVGPDLGYVIAERPFCDYIVAVERWEPAGNGSWSYEQFVWFLYPTVGESQEDALRKASAHFEKLIRESKFL